MYTYGTQVQLTATADADSNFYRWSGDCTSCGTNTSCTISLNSSKSCSAEFTIKQYNITTNVTPTNTGSISCTPNLVNYGATASCTITPNTGYSISSVTGCGGTLSGNTYTTGVITSDCTVTVNFIDTAIPNLVLTMLPNNSVTKDKTLNIAGKIVDESGIKSLTVNGNGVTINPDGTFSYALTLQEGENVVTIIGTDNSANENQVKEEREIILDTTPPVITVQQPADNSRTNQQALEIKGTLSEDGDVEIKLNGESKGYADKAGLTFSKVLLLKEGINEIIIDAKDIAGNNIESIKRTVTYDYKAPNLSITEPSQDITTQDRTIKIKGSFLDDYSDASKVTIKVEVDGVPVTGVVVSSQDKTFEYTLEMTQSKQYKIKVTAIDEVNNESTVERNILFKPKSGDVNKDGKVDILDALLALRVAVGLEQQTADMLQEGDVAPLLKGLPNPDGKITTGDAIVILRKIVGKVSW